MEHEFKKPVRSEVEDFLDVANLFLLYTQQFINRRFTQFQIMILYDEVGQHNPIVEINFDLNEGLFELTLKRGRSWLQLP